jgi:hypothetical protein
MTALASGTETLEIKEGLQKTADRSRLTIKFVEIVEDSRCPPDVNCVWAGNAKIKLSISKGKAAPKFVEINTGLDPKSVKVAGYEIKLEKLTHRVPEHLMMHDKPLVATFTITKLTK